MPPLAPNSRCAISIKNMLSNTSTFRIALYVLYIPTASYAHGLSLNLRLYDLHLEKVPDLGSLNHSSPKTGFSYPAHGGLRNSPRIGREIHSPKSPGPGLRPVGTDAGPGARNGTGRLFKIQGVVQLIVETERGRYRM
jgi:hypothetical protein